MPVSRGLIYAGGQKRGHAARFPIFNETLLLLLLLPLPPPPLLPSSSRGGVRRMRDSAGASLGKIAATPIISCSRKGRRRVSCDWKFGEERQNRRPVEFPRSGRARGTRPRSVLPIRSVSTVNGQKFCHDSASPAGSPPHAHRTPTSANDPNGSRGIPDAVPEIPEWRRHLPRRGDVSHACSDAGEKSSRADTRLSGAKSLATETRSAFVIRSILFGLMHPGRKLSPCKYREIISLTLSVELLLRDYNIVLYNFDIAKWETRSTG